MSVWNYIILLWAAAAALVPMGGRSGSRRYLIWLAAIVTTYAASVLYWDADGPYPEAFAFMCDAMLVLSFCIAGRYVWESRVAVLFLASTFVNMAYLAHNIVGAHLVPQDVYAATLEIINVIAIGVIGVTAAFDRAGHTDGRAFHPWVRIFGVMRHVPGRSGPHS